MSSPGVRNGPVHFQREMSRMFAQIGLIYQDDLAIAAESETNMLEKLREVLEICRAHHLKINWKKSQFLVDELKFLGRIVSQKGISVDLSRCAALEQLSVPHNKDELRSFLSLATYYSEFIPSYAVTAFPLWKLLRRHQEFT